MNSLTADSLLEAAGDTIFDRGVEYVPYVFGLRSSAKSAMATIGVRQVYTCHLDWADELTGSCTCPFNAKGYFCKHLTALGLAVLNASGGAPVNEDGARSISETAQVQIVSWLAELSRERLVELVHELASLSDVGLLILEMRAAVSVGDTTSAEQPYIEDAKARLAFRGYLDYRRSSDVAYEIEAILDEYETILDSAPGRNDEASPADVLRPALEYVLKRARTISESADDSNGGIGDALSRAVGLHARACAEGTPDPKKLAHWLVSYRRTSPGWPETPLSLYVDAFDEIGLSTYRQGIEKYAADPETSEFDRRTVLLELADHDHDLDRAVEILGTGEYIYYREIVLRLREANRLSESMVWLDRAVAAGKITLKEPSSFWLGIDEVVDWLHSAGRQEDALDLIHALFAARPSVSLFGSLIRYADRLGVDQTERAWARESVEAYADREGNGDAAIEIALADDDIEQAWMAHGRWGSRHAWRKLAEASASEKPREAADLYRPYLNQLLPQANTQVYPEVANVLRRMRDGYAAVGAEKEIDSLIAEIRDTYRRRPALMRALDAAGLRSVK
ncbi:SWIM zinc finger family protein [Gulosibacter molinativorax]|uniref:SWIM-type domain-containing protein n=1 Tax=Gulosibacter molinativorax TaxID=256821 RepID=A0ABT7CDR1_9MICO|nr:SWIM zinc finger family protein [Gulosibacter molinativorax]MDJ1372764.1 hypothetical protein [Gulosibacter molinativorax]QUY63367.1 Zinc finger, SWIM domain protein [Gulosibacter molinativorax]